MEFYNPLSDQTVKPFSDLKAPPEFKEIHSDFSPDHENVNNSTASWGSWIVSIVFMPIVFMGGYAVGGWAGSILACLLALAWPIMTTLGDDVNKDILRYCTWVYRTTQPKICHVKGFTLGTLGPLREQVTVTAPDREYQCHRAFHVVRPGDSMDADMSVFFSPDTGYPICAEHDGVRYWLEPQEWLK